MSFRHFSLALVSITLFSGVLASFVSAETLHPDKEKSTESASIKDTDREMQKVPDDEATQNHNLQQNGKDKRKGQKQDRIDLRTNFLTQLQAATTSEAQKAILLQAASDRDAMRAKHEEAKKAFKDDKRKMAGTHVDEAATILNAVLSQITATLQRVTLKVADLKSLGKDTTSADEAITKTQAALAAAGGTTDQSISIIDSALLKTPVDREGIKSAIIVARDSIHAAHSALKDAFKAFAEVSITTDSH